MTNYYEVTVIDQCKWCGRKLKARTKEQAKYNLEKHENACPFKKDIVYAYVCGDVLHIGHITHLLNAKALGNKLIVGVLTDEAIMERKQKPIFSFKERIDLIRNLKCVDVVVPQETYSPLPNVKNIKPNILAESTSHKPEDIKAAEAVMKEIGGRVIVMPYYKEQSSTNIKETIKKSWKK
jgi:rfaE bifunctional protein nucleotidyltransferase chain/domain